MKGGICCIGEVVVDFVAPEPNARLLDASTFKRCAGGAPANVAVGIARLGGRSSLISCVGKDCWGDYFEEVLREEGVCIKGIQRTPDASTTLAFVSLSEDGERDFSFIRSPGADTRLRADKLDEGTLDACSILHCGTFSMSSEPSRSATMAAIESVKGRGGIISLDVNYRASVWSTPQDAIDCVEEVLPRVDILKVSEEEALLLTGQAEPVKAAKLLLAKGVRVVLVSLGSEGCIVVTNTVRFSVPARVVECVDATGAGDSFIAAFLHRFLEGGLRFDDVNLLEESSRFACMAASITVTGYGAIPSLPREVLACS